MFDRGFLFWIGSDQIGGIPERISKLTEIDSASILNFRSLRTYFERVCVSLFYVIPIRPGPDQGDRAGGYLSTRALRFDSELRR